ncbi:hypothetical protein GALL_456710 [mine drainage metagenome]|uniref:Uncharacterized protein n=1 Tax=mine drainage metagenome TaxID=410659 RepID=A0A1J5Q9P0_9ZZZZ
MLFLRKSLRIAFIALLPIIATAQTTGTQITFGDKKQDYPFLSRELTAREHRHDMPPLRASPTFARFSVLTVRR